jgi:hypothetical protein
MDAVQGGLGHGLINAQPKADLHEQPNVRFVQPDIERRTKYLHFFPE